MRCLITAILLASSAWASGELSGRRAPGFSLFDWQYQRQYDPQDFRGKVIVLEFMQTNCPHCAQFADILEEVNTKYAGRIAVFSVVNPPDNPNTVGAYVSGHRTKVPVLFDCGQVAASYFKATPQNASFDVPHVFLIDAQGMIRNDWAYSLLTREIFEGRALFEEIDRLLGGAASPKRSTRK